MFAGKPNKPDLSMVQGLEVNICITLLLSNITQLSYAFPPISIENVIKHINTINRSLKPFFLPLPQQYSLIALMFLQASKFCLKCRHLIFGLI